MVALCTGGLTNVQEEIWVIRIVSGLEKRKKIWKRSLAKSIKLSSCVVSSDQVVLSVCWRIRGFAYSGICKLTSLSICVSIVVACPSYLREVIKDVDWFVATNQGCKSVSGGSLRASK